MKGTYQDAHEYIRSTLTGGADESSIIRTVQHIHNLSKEDAIKAVAQVKKEYALEATTMDALAELMISYKRRMRMCDDMARHAVRNPDLPTSWHVNRRRLLNDTHTSLLGMIEHRERFKRDRSEKPENEAQKQVDLCEFSGIHFRSNESGRMQGYFYDPINGMKVPATNLLSEQLAIRDVIRMRFLPKSPREDFLLAKMMGVLTDDESKVDPNTISDKEIPHDLQYWDPRRFAVPGRSDYEKYTRVTQAVFLERIHEYNKVWDKALKWVDDQIIEKNLKAKVTNPDQIGIPSIIQKAVTGDDDAKRVLTKALWRTLIEIGLVQPDAAPVPMDEAKGVSSTSREDLHPQLSIGGILCPQRPSGWPPPPPYAPATPPSIIAIEEAHKKRVDDEKTQTKAKDEPSALDNLRKVHAELKEELAGKSLPPLNPAPPAAEPALNPNQCIDDLPPLKDNCLIPPIQISGPSPITVSAEDLAGPDLPPRLSPPAKCMATDWPLAVAYIMKMLLVVVSLWMCASQALGAQNLAAMIAIEMVGEVEAFETVTPDEAKPRSVLPLTKGTLEGVPVTEDSRTHQPKPQLSSSPTMMSHFFRTG